MTDKEAIKYLQQLYPNGGHCWLDEQRIEAISMAIKALQEEPQVKESAKTQHVDKTCKENGNSLTQEPVSEDLEKEMDNYLPTVFSKDMDGGEPRFTTWFKALRKTAIYFAKWQKENLWKPADGDDLPEIDREVIVLVQDYPDDKVHLRVAFAHRPSKCAKFWNSLLGEEQVVEIEGYDKGGWNIPNVKYWLDYNIDSIIKED